MKKIILIGAGGHAKVIKNIIDCINDSESNIKIIAVFDEYLESSEVFGLPILNKRSQLTELINEDYMNTYCVIGIGDNKIRKRIADEYEYRYMSAIHPTAVISNDCVIGEGTVVMAGSIINSGTHIGKHCIINTGSIIEHDNEIDDYVHISPGVITAGNVKVGSMTHLGIGSIVIQGIIIGINTVVGAGAVVVRDVESNEKVVGVPAKSIG